MHKVRIPFGALRPALTVAIAVVASGWALAQFMSQLVPLQPQQPAGSLPPGTELIYRVTSASHPGPSAGPDARVVAGEGFSVVTVHAWEETGCVVTVTMYALHPLDGSLGSAGSQPVLGTPDECGDIWMSGPALAGAERTADQHTTVGSGPLEVNGRTYETVIINHDPQQGRPYSRTAYDHTTGVLVFSSGGYGDRSWGATPSMAYVPQPVGKPFARSEMPKMELDFFPTATLPSDQERPRALPASEQPFPSDRVNFRLVHVANGRAMIEDSDGLWVVQRGSQLPDASRVAAIEQRDGRWVLVTTHDKIVELSD